MTRVTIRRTLLLCFFAASAVFAACGGGSGEEKGDGIPVTDPARVRTATPLQNATLYHIQGDLVSTSGGSATITPITGGTGTGSSRNHTVASGDNCGGIAAQYKVTLEELRRVNRTINDSCSNLNVGDIIRIPAAITPVTGGGSSATATPRPGTSGGGKAHTVKSGDTCADIAGSFGVTVAGIISANGLNQNCSLQVGQLIKIP